MRRLLLVTVILAAAALAPAAAAKVTYCSPTGDYCTSALKKAGTIKLTLSTFSFSGRYRLCVKPIGAAQTCKSFPLRRRGDVWRSEVTWYKNFPKRSTGIFRATWFYGGVRLGPPLTFVVANS